MFQKGKTTNKLTALLLALVMLLSLLPSFGLTALAIAPEDATWSANQSITENTDIGKLTVNTDITVTIAEGKTVTVHFGIDASDHTLTVAGAGTLVVKGKEGNKGNDNGDDEDPNPAESGTSGESGVTGNLVVNGATVQITGGKGGDGGNAHYYGGSGGSGGNGVQGNVTVIGGAITITGGNGGTGGQAYAGNGSNGTAGRAVTGTISGDAEESAEGDNWIAVSADTSTARYVKVTAAAAASTPTAVNFTKVSSADEITAENIGTCTAEEAKAWILANWYDVTDSYAAVIAFYSNTGELNVVWFYCGINEEEFSNDFDNYINTTTSISDIQQGFDTSASVFICTAAATAYAGLKNTTTVVHFDSKDWYLIEDNSTSATEGTVTLLSKECVGASKFGDNNTYSGSTLESYVNSYYADNFSAAAQAAVSEGLFILTREQAQTIHDTNVDVLKCSQADGADYNKWWLSSSGSNKFYAAYVYGDSGDVSNSGSLLTMYGVRPALNLDLSKVEFDSETNTFALPAAAVTEYPLWVGGVLVTSENMSGEGWNYAADTNTLTLNGYTNSGTARADIQSGVNNAAIYYNDNMFSPNPLTIQLAEGTTNSLTMTGDRVYGIYVFGSALTITGNGTLNVQSEEMAINDAWGVAITGGTVYAASSGYYGINSVTIGADISSVTITGNLGAIYGGSNEEQELINAVAGTGWTDTTGTTGKSAIAISTTGQNVSSYKKVYFTPHTHDFTYSVSGATITATCTDGCPAGYDNANKPTLTIVAPELNVYGGTGSEKATLDGLDAFNNATGLNVDADSIVYWNAKIQEGVYKTDGDEPLTAAPTDAGNYLAKITVSNCIASVGYPIAKANITPTVSLEGWAYGATAKTPVVIGNSGNGTVTYTYATKGSDSFSATVPTNAGNYTVKATVAATANYNGGTATADFTIAKANITPTVTLEGWTYGETAKTPVVSGNLGNGDVTFTYAKNGVKGNPYSETVPTEAGDYVVLATIAETANYNGGEATAEFTIAKADSVPATVTANKLTCDGTEKALVTVTGEVAGGEMQYALGKDAQTAPEDGWSTDIPAATNTGTYFVWYKVVADENHNDSTPVCVEVTIDPDYTVKEVTGLSGNGEDEWTKGGEDGVVITVKDSGEDNSFDHFTGVKLDGQLLTKDVDYTVTKGSTIVTLLPATLEKLSVGEHTVTVLFDNGEVNTDLTVKAANSGSATSPKTGDNSHMGLWIAIMILSLCALVAMLFIGKKKRVFDR